MFGWTIVGSHKENLIPAAAFQEYGFHPDDRVVFTLGSRQSGGFGLGHREKVASSIIRKRIVGEGTISKEMHIFLPPEIKINLGKQLLDVRGSNLALGFLKKGLIIDEASLHPELEVYRS